MVYAIKSAQFSRKSIKKASNDPLRGPVPPSTMYVYVQAHRSGFLSHNFYVYTYLCIITYCYKPAIYVTFYK